MRWLAHRGGALDFRDHALANPGQPFPIAVALGADPATILGAVTPVPDTLSEYQFAGLLRGARTEIVKCLIARPAGAGVAPRSCWKAISIRRERSDRLRDALEGPFGDHTGYYNEQRALSRCSRSSASRMRRDPIYHSTYTGKPPDEPAVLGRGAERGVRAAAAKAVSGDRRFLPAAGRLPLPAGGGAA